jgi:hypothetical protein
MMDDHKALRVHRGLSVLCTVAKVAAVLTGGFAFLMSPVVYYGGSYAGSDADRLASISLADAGICCIQCVLDNSRSRISFLRLAAAEELLGFLLHRGWVSRLRNLVFLAQFEGDHTVDAKQRFY